MYKNYVERAQKLVPLLANKKEHWYASINLVLKPANTHFTYNLQVFNGQGLGDEATPNGIFQTFDGQIEALNSRFFWKTFEAVCGDPIYLGLTDNSDNPSTPLRKMRDRPYNCISMHISFIEARLAPMRSVNMALVGFPTHASQVVFERESGIETIQERDKPYMKTHHEWYQSPWEDKFDRRLFT